VAAKYRKAIGFLVTDNLDITISNWKLVPKKMKKDLWKKLRTRFIFRVESRAVAKEYTMRQCAISFRNWRSELNIKFVKKGLDATKKYKNITATKWKTFGEQKTSEEFLSKSQANSELAKKNIYHHALALVVTSVRFPNGRQTKLLGRRQGYRCCWRMYPKWLETSFMRENHKKVRLVCRGQIQ